MDDEPSSVPWLTRRLTHDDASPEDRAEALAALKTIPDGQLFAMLEGVRLSPEVVSFVSSILFACDLTPQSEQVFRRRKKCFEVAISAMKEGSLSPQGCRDLTQVMGEHARQLYSEQILSLVDAVLSGGAPGGASSLAPLLDLLPVLVGDSSNCREYAVEKLYEMSWPRDLVLGYMAALVSLCGSDADCERAMSKVMSYLVAGEGPAGSALYGVDTEELPVLVYHLTSISRKCAPGGGLKASLLEVLAESLDVIMATVQEGAGRGPSTVTHASRAERVSSGGATEAAYVRRMRPVLGTITHHATALLSKDQGVAEELLTLLRARRLTTSHSECFHAAGGPLLSPSKLLLAMLASKTPRNEMRTLAGLIEVVQEAYAQQPIAGDSMWFQPGIWSRVVRSTPHHLCAAFSALLRDCSLMHLEASTAPLVNLALALLTTTHSLASDVHLPGQGTREALLGASLGPASTHSRQLFMTERVDTRHPASSCAFGAWLLAGLFVHNEHARPPIARELVLRLTVHAQIITMPSSGGRVAPGRSQARAEVSSAMGHSEKDQIATLLCVSVLERLAVSCPDGLASVAGELQDAFLALPSLPASVAGRLVTVLGAFFGASPGLSDRYTLALRKSGFARDSAHRRAAVGSLLALLRLQVGAPSIVHKHRSDGHSSSQPAPSGEDLSQPFAPASGGSPLLGPSVEEILSMCRRFLSCQRDVRTLLVDLMVQLQLDYPACRGVVLRLLHGHLSGLVLEDRYDLTWAPSSACSRRAAGRVPDGDYSVLNADRFVDLTDGCPQEILSDLLLGCLTLACPFRRSPADMLLGEERVSSMRPPLRPSQWGDEDMTFQGTGPSMKPASEIYLSFCGEDFTARRLCDDLESVEARQSLLKICKGLTDTALGELRIPVRVIEGQGTSRPDQYRVFALLEGYHAALSCAVILPDQCFVECDEWDMREERSQRYVAAAASRPRLQLLHYLCVRAEQVTALAAAARKAGKPPSPFSGTAHVPHASSPLIRLVAGCGAGAADSMRCALRRDTAATGCPADMHAGLHLLVAEFQFVCQVLTLLNADDEEEEPPMERPIPKDTQGGSNIGAGKPAPEGLSAARVADLLTPETIAFLEVNVLERATVAFQCVLGLLGAIAADHASVPGGGTDDSTRGTDGEGVLWAWWGWFALRSLNVGIFTQLLTFFRRQRTRDRSGRGAGRAGGDRHCVFSPRHLSPLQLVLRAIVGSLRFEVSLAQLIATHYSAADRIAQYPVGRDVVDANSGLVLLLENGFESILRSRREGGTSYGSMLTQRLNMDGSTTQGTAPIAYTQDGDGAATQWVNVLQTHIKNFAKLFLAMQATDSERNESPLILCVLSELFDVLSVVPAAQRDSSDQLLRYCRDKLSAPGGTVSRGLIQLLVVHGAPDPADRLRRALQAALMVQYCARPNEEIGQEDSDAEDDPLFRAPQAAGGGCILVSESTAHSSALAVIQMMEKALAEAELLHKLTRKECTRIDRPGRAVFAWTQGATDRAGSSPNELITITCATLLRVIHVVEKLMHPTLAAASVKLLAVVVKVYKFLVKLAKEVQTRVSKGIEPAGVCVSPMFRTLCTRVVDSMAPRLSDYLLDVRNVECTVEGGSSGSEDGGESRPKKGKVKRITVNQRLKKLVPDIIYQVEQLDVVFIRLSGVLKGVEKVIVAKWIRRTSVCDFKLKADMIQPAQQRAEDAERRRDNRKRKKPAVGDEDGESDQDENCGNRRRLEGEAVVDDAATEMPDDMDLY